MKKMYFLIFLLTTVFCFSDEDLKLPDNYIFPGRDFQKNVTFWDEFEHYKDSFQDYDSNADQLVGRWNDIVFSKSGEYWFFPNNLFIEGVYVPHSENRILQYIIGEWKIVGKVVTVTIYGYLYDEKENNKTVNTIYTKCNPYTVSLFDVTKIDPIGYSKQKMNYIPFPHEIDNLIVEKYDYEIPCHRYRMIYTFDIFSQPRPPFDKRYSLFSVIPTIVEEQLSAEDIIDDEEIMMRLFGDTSLVLQ